MAPRIRTLKPDCWQDAAIGRLSPHARLLFIGLITQADDEGRLVAEPALLRAQIFPYDVETVSLDDVGDWLRELDAQGLVSSYRVGANHYAALPAWKRNQNISHPAESRIPEPDPEASRKPPEDSGGSMEASGPRVRARIGKERIGRDRNGKEGSGNEVATVFAFWKSSFALNGRTQFTPERKRKIKQRLEDSTPDEIRAAITGVSQSKWHRENGHTDISLICRDRSHVERYMALKDKPAGGQAGVIDRRIQAGLEAAARTQGGQR